MSAVVVDTNIVSYMMKRAPEAALYRRHLDGPTLAISFATVGELYEGAYRGRWGPRRLSELAEIVSAYVVLPYDSQAAEIWGRVRAHRRAQPIAAQDAWIAATALAYGCPLVTHDASDFDGIDGLEVITEAGA